MVDEQEAMFLVLHYLSAVLPEAAGGIAQAAAEKGLLPDTFKGLDEPSSTFSSQGELGRSNQCADARGTSAQRVCALPSR